MTSPHRNLAAWLGPVLALAAFVSYFGLFYRWPATRDVPWLNFGLLIAAAGLSLFGLRRAWDRGLRRRIAAGAGLVVSAGMGVLFLGYTQFLSAELPDSESGLPVGAALPALELPDQTGRSVSLTELGRDPVVLVFYRGHW